MKFKKIVKQSNQEDVTKETGDEEIHLETIKSPSKMNIERGLISKLLETGDMTLFKDKQIKPSFFRGENAKIIRYLDEYYMTNGCLPTARVFSSKYPKFKLESYENADGRTIVGTDEPLTYWCNELRMKVIHNTVCEELEEVFPLLDSFQTTKATDKIKKMILHLESELVESSSIDITSDKDARKLAYEERKRNKGMIGIPMGIDRLDTILKGMQPKQLITLIAKTGLGKTWFFILLAAYCQLHGYSVLFFTTEMSEEQIEDRLEAMLMGMLYDEFNYSKFKSGTLDKEQEELYFEFLDRKEKFEPLIVESASGCGVSYVNAKIQQRKPDIVFIDGVYLMEDDRGSDQDWLRVTHITRDVKQVAKSTKIPILINSQADRTTSTKTGPELENIGFSSAIGHDSDVVLALFRDEEMLEDREMKVKILKQREGITGSVMLNWDFSTMNFSPIYSDVSDSEVKSGESNYVQL